MDKLTAEVEVVLGSFNLNRMDKLDNFMLKKKIKHKIENYLGSVGINANVIKVDCDMNKLAGLYIKFNSTVPESEIKPRISEQALRDSVVNSVSDIFLKNFNSSIPQQIICKFVNVNDAITNESGEDKDSIDQFAGQFKPVDPLYKFEDLIVKKETQQNIETALEVVEHGGLVFEKWGLKKIEPFPRAVLNFFGPPGTGKTLAAHAIASKLTKKLLIVGCPEVQSKYHGDSSKRLKAVFRIAEQSDAVLFFDESDSLLSKRLSEVNTGAEDEINNMRNTMLTCLESHKGIVIFASNFVKRYDYAFETRVQSIEFPLPDSEMKERLWRKLFLDTIETQGEINFTTLVENSTGFCGRDIKNAVIKACFMAVHKGNQFVTEQDLLDACANIRNTRAALKKADYSRVEANEEKKPTLRELMDKKEKSWQNSYLSAVPCEDRINIRKLIGLAQQLSSGEVMQAIDNACYSALSRESEKVSEQDIIAALEQAINMKQTVGETGEDTMEQFKAVLQELINKRKESDNFNCA